MTCLNISFFFVWFHFNSVLLTRDLHKAKEADVTMSGTTPFTVSSTSQLNLAIVLPEIPSYFVCLELQYFLSIWKYSSNAVHHCNLYLNFLWKYRSVLLSAMYLEEVHMSTSLQMWVDVFWRSSSFPRQLTSNFCPEMYLCFTLFIDLHIIRTCIFTLLADLFWVPHFH